ncbi:unnamed protein product [Schistosoma margrebowiei]|uniref:Uncharacterized protein n=1 Tax=Schistosoma margrebowiei TaxID=48269 RepID=A0A183LWS9_9TREM|nr:unnamed protein product [Schistosoma margrebowiei]
MLSSPAAFPLLIYLMAILISSVVGGLTSIRRSLCAASMSDGFIGAGLFKSSSKYSTHLFCYKLL